MDGMIQPTDDRVLVRRLPRGTGLVQLTDADKSSVGMVLAIGPGKRSKRGGRIPLAVVPGDVVLFNPRWNDLSSDDWEHKLRLEDDPNLHMIREADIIVVYYKGMPLDACIPTEQQSVNTVYHEHKDVQV